MKSYLPFIIKTVAVEKVHRDRIVAIHLWGEKRLGVARKGEGRGRGGREEGSGEGVGEENDRINVFLIACERSLGKRRPRSFPSRS